MFRKILQFFKDVKKENLDNIIDNSENIKKQINEIFDEVTTDKNFSLYKLDLLNRKIALLSGAMVNEKTNIDKYAQKVSKLMFYKSNIILLLPLLCLILTITNLGFVSLGLAILELYFIKYCNELYFNCKGKKEEFSSMNKGLENTVTSCQNLIYGKMQKNYKFADEPEKENLTIEQQANYNISYFIDHGVMLPVNDEVINEVVKILQYELNTNQGYYEILLSMAAEKANEENLQEELVRSRKKENK